MGWMKMVRKGFIYSAPRPPYKPFTFKKTKAVLEGEELIREALNDPSFSFTDEQAFCYNEGYMIGYIDGEHDHAIALLDEYREG